MLAKSGFSSSPTNLVPCSSNKCPRPPDFLDSFEPDDQNVIILDRFRAYKKVIHARQLHFERPDRQTGELREITVEAASMSRYTPQGRVKIKRKLSKRLPGQQVSGCLLTLTCDPKRYTICEAWEHIWSEYAAFRKRLLKFLQRNGRAHSPLYVAVLEAHKTGYPHLHVAYPSLRYLAPKKIINAAWKMGSTHIAGSRRGGRGVTLSPLRYVLKYVVKLSGWSELALAHLWHARARLYNISPRLYPLPKEPKVPGWTLTKIGYLDEAFRDLARHLARLRFIHRTPTRKEVHPVPFFVSMMF